jgi:Putative Flp pilus-assembly TadE/G-like
MNMRSLYGVPHRGQQRGQAVVWFLAMIAACCCAFALVYNVGQVANEKEKTTNAADAAALSGSLVEARMLNFEAYTNRAMVANEVTVAQLVSLDSWLRYDNEMLYWIAFYTQPIPYLDDLTQSASDASQGATDAFDSAMPVLLKIPEAANLALHSAREAVNLAGMMAPTAVAEQIASENQSTFAGQSYDAVLVPNFVPTIAQLNKDTWQAFTADYSDDQRTNAKDVMLNSRDVFTAQRKEGELIDLLNDALQLVGLGVVYPNFVKTSGSTTLKDFDHWEGQDSLDMSMTAPSFCLGFIPCGESTNFVKTPIGYGRSDAESNDDQGDNLCDYQPSTYNCTQAWQNGGSPVSWNGTTGDGIPNLRDLAQGLSKTDPCSTNNGSDSPSLRFVAAVQKDGTATATTQRYPLNTVDVSGPQGSPKMTDNLQNGDKVTSIAEACTFFLRPDLNKQHDPTQGSLARQDGVHEYASLYNPYWQARLTNPDQSFKQKLLQLIGASNLDSLTPQPTNPDAAQ